MKKIKENKVTVNKVNTVDNRMDGKKGKKKFYKKKRFWLIVLLILLIGNVGSSGEKTEVKEATKTVTQVEEKQKAKESKNDTKEKDKNDTEEKKDATERKKDVTEEKKDADEVLENFQENLDKTNAKLIKKEISEFLYIEIGDSEVAKEISKTKIKSVKLKNQKLRINLDTSEVNIEMLDNEATAMLISAGVTEELLRHDEFDDYWNTVTINFKDIGSLKYSEDDVELNKEGGFRQFPIFEQFANGEVSFK